jgi:hypothetical protein
MLTLHILDFEGNTEDGLHGIPLAIARKVFSVYDAMYCAAFEVQFGERLWTCAALPLCTTQGKQPYNKLFASGT